LGICLKLLGKEKLGMPAFFACILAPQLKAHSKDKILPSQNHVNSFSLDRWSVAFHYRSPLVAIPASEFGLGLAETATHFAADP